MRPCPFCDGETCAFLVYPGEVGHDGASDSPQARRSCYSCDWDQLGGGPFNHDAILVGSYWYGSMFRDGADRTGRVFTRHNVGNNRRALRNHRKYGSPTYPPVSFTPTSDGVVV